MRMLLCGDKSAAFNSRVGMCAETCNEMFCICFNHISDNVYRCCWGANMRWAGILSMEVQSYSLNSTEM